MVFYFGRKLLIKLWGVVTGFKKALLYANWSQRDYLDEKEDSKLDSRELD